MYMEIVSIERKTFEAMVAKFGAKGFMQGLDGLMDYAEHQAREILRIRALMEQMLAGDTGQPIEKVSKDIERDKYLTAEEAVEYGIVDDILTSLKDADA